MNMAMDVEKRKILLHNRSKKSKEKIMRLKKELSTPVLTEKVRSILMKISRSRSKSASLTKRTTVALMASEGATNQDIAKHLNMPYNNVAKWRKRFIEATPK